MAPMVAVHRTDAKKSGKHERCGAADGAVTVYDKSVEASVEDQLGVAGRIDLNPASAKKLGLNPPFTVDCTWEWV